MTPTELVSLSTGSCAEAVDESSIAWAGRLRVIARYELELPSALAFSGRWGRAHERRHLPAGHGAKTGTLSKAAYGGTRTVL